MSNEDIKKILSREPVQLCEECMKCEWNEIPSNRHKPCYYKYCDKGKRKLEKSE